MRTQVKQLLAIRNRSLRKHPGKLLLGPTGARLWADYLDSAPGFLGRTDFIHKLNLPLLFTLKAGERDPLLMPADAVWYPDELRLTYECSAFSFNERKLITWQDEAISLQCWVNRSKEPLTLQYILPVGAKEDEIYTFPTDLHGLKVIMLSRTDPRFVNGAYTLRPGETLRFLAVAALGLAGEEEALWQKTSAALTAPDPEMLFNEKCAEYLRWFDAVPEFECSDPYIARCWWYRAFILRSSLAKPDLGYLKHTLFYEGRAHAMAKKEYAPSGWEFSRLIPLSTPLTMTDMRWIRQPEIAKEAFRALTDTFNSDGAFSVSAVDVNGREYCQYASWALYNFYLLWGDKAFIEEVLEDFKRDVRSVFTRHKGKNDSLQICYTHALTGKEYQPGYWFFTDQCFPAKVRGTQEGYSPLKRVDSSIYTYLNCLGLKHLCGEIGDADAEEFAQKAKEIRGDVLSKMWDEPSGCFYDLHYQTDRKAYVKHIVSVYPLWAGITDEKHLKLFDYLLSPSYFARGSGFASVAADCSVYSPSGGWKGDYFKGRDGCMWNGPSWPYTTGIALDALARQSKLHDHAFDAPFARYFREYTLEHFRFSDLNQPCLVEHYHAETGEALSDEADYNHSFYMDLIVRHLCGIEPDGNGLKFQPINMELDFFCIRGVQVKGHDVDVYYQKETGHYPDLTTGYTLLIDGKTVYQVSNADSAACCIRLDFV